MQLFAWSVISTNSNRIRYLFGAVRAESAEEAYGAAYKVGKEKFDDPLTVHVGPMNDDFLLQYMKDKGLLNE